MLAQVVVNGLLLGGIYTLMGVGFSLQWGISGVINLAYGGTLVLGAYLAFSLAKLLAIQPLLTVIPAGIALFVVGFVIYQLFLRPTLKRGSFVVTLVMTFAIELVLENIMLLVWSSDYRMVSGSFSNLILHMSNVYVPATMLIIFGASLLVTYLVYLFMSKTRTGHAIQAAALNADGAEITGINVQRMYAINFAVGSAIGGVAGALMATINSFSVVMTGTLLGKVFVIAILGGLGNIWGALLGGLTLGLVESCGALVVSPAYSQALGLGVMVLVLVLRPRGLIGRKYWDVY